ncbi:hypothetical protein BS78_05G228800 [Paspalum vaginatum]|nr:hypothetical protein BS78_05G228800 [Paspalum vaginatum]
MASVGAAKVKTMAMVAAICVPLLLLSMCPPATADVEDDCRATCIPKCSAYASALCHSIVKRFPALNLTYTTCKVRLNVQCKQACITVCSPNTPTPAGAPASPPLPPCKPY